MEQKQQEKSFLISYMKACASLKDRANHRKILQWVQGDLVKESSQRYEKNRLHNVASGLLNSVISFRLYNNSVAEPGIL